ncbi:CPBP family intramembrane glutamic endopeptidase [Grimontia marina]|uniref:CAAX amino terminal protease self-immunity n=1 Tax=Grimontia marina TaxID=646534 RepID=A0A128EZW5_9GAMM|nr:type II CAAX endopeptidase family protein [Grimontia marina]CZF80089.1 CAAX amino terminal protease self-immunity [Grimontia marina]
MSSHIEDAPKRAPSAIKNIGRSISWTVAHSAIYFGILVPLIILWYQVMGKHEVYGEWFNHNGVVMIVVNDIIQISVFYLFIKFIKKENLFKRCNFVSFSKTTALYIIALSISAAIFTHTLFALPYLKNNFGGYESVMAFLVDTPSTWSFVLFLIIGSFYKEIFFRGLLFNEMRRGLHIGICYALLCVIYTYYFELMRDIPLMIYAAIGTCLFTTLYLWTRSMYAAVIMQFLSTGGIYVLRHNAMIEQYNHTYHNALLLITFGVIAFSLYKVYSLSKRSTVHQHSDFKKYAGN